jgi:hypothetical protein
MKTLIIITLLLTTGCASNPMMGQLAMAFLQAKAASGSTAAAVNRGYGSAYADPMTVYNQNQFFNRQQQLYMYNDKNYGAGAVGQ